MGLPQRQISKEEYDLYEREVWNAIKLRNFQRRGYIPHAEQLKVHNSTARFRVVVAGRRSGKTKLATEEALDLLCDPNRPNSRIWVVSKTYSLADKIFYEVFEQATIGKKKEGQERKPALLHPSQIKRKVNSQQEGMIRTAWGSEVIRKTADNPDSLIGDELDLLIFDECAKCKEKIWDKYLRPTLADREGRAIFPTTPEGQNWVHALFLKGQSKDYPDYESFHFTSHANPNLSKEEIEKAKRELSPESFAQEWLADFFSFKGKTYKEFTKNTHVIQTVPKKFKTVVAGVDFGFINPSAITVIGIDNDDNYTVIDEFYQSGLTITELIAEGEKLKKDHGISLFYADPSQPAYIKEMNGSGLHTLAAKNDILPGIDAVSEKLKIRIKTDRPGLLISAGCVHLISEIQNYRYADSDNKNIKEVPVKKDDHACDALRYAIYSLKKTFKPKTFKGNFL